MTQTGSAGPVQPLSPTPASAKLPASRPGGSSQKQTSWCSSGSGSVLGQPGSASATTARVAGIVSFFKATAAYGANWMRVQPMSVRTTSRLLTLS